MMKLAIAVACLFSAGTADAILEDPKPDAPAPDDPGEALKLKLLDDLLAQDENGKPPFGAAGEPGEPGTPRLGGDEAHQRVLRWVRTLNQNSLDILNSHAGDLRQLADAMAGLNHHLGNLLLATHDQQNRFTVDLQRIIRARGEGDLPAATLMEAGLEQLAASMKLVRATMDLHEKTILPPGRHLSTHSAESSGSVPERSFRPFPDEDERVSSLPVKAKTTAKRGVWRNAR